MLEGERKWNMRLIIEVFWEEEVVVILQSPIRQSARED